MFLFLFLPTIYSGCKIKLDDSGQEMADCWEMKVPGPVEGTLTDEDSCQAWALIVGEHAYVNIFVEDEFIDCDAQLEDFLAIPHDPTYSNMGDEGPKWTYDFLAVSEGEGAASVSCDDGNLWEGYFIVESASVPP
jgi:hypothetical protein